MTRPTVIGLDLSITATGICGGDGICTTVGGKADLGDHRLTIIAEAVVDEVMISYPGSGEAPSRLVVIEDVPTHAKSAGITAMVHGAVRARLLELDLDYLHADRVPLDEADLDRVGRKEAARAQGRLSFGCSPWGCRSDA